MRNYFCHKDPSRHAVQELQSILDESVHDDTPAMRSNIRAQCQSKIDRLKEDDGIEVK